MLSYLMWLDGLMCMFLVLNLCFRFEVMVWVLEIFLDFSCLCLSMLRKFMLLFMLSCMVWLSCMLWFLNSLVSIWWVIVVLIWFLMLLLMMGILVLVNFLVYIGLEVMNIGSVLMNVILVLIVYWV